MPNHEMGSIFEELIRRFAEQSNDTAGDHFTPRDVVNLLVDLLFLYDSEILTGPGVVRTMYDPTAGTGGILSLAQENLRRINPKASLVLFGQEINPESYAICKSDLLIKDQDADNIKFGNTLTQDGHEDLKVDYMGANPPYGVDWGKVRKAIQDERKGKIQLINAADLFVPMRKSLGDKRREISPDQIADVVRLVGEFEEGPRSKIFDNAAFGYRRITEERPMRWSYQATPERIDQALKGLLALRGAKGKNLPPEIRRVLEAMNPNTVFPGMQSFIEAFFDTAERIKSPVTKEKKNDLIKFLFKMRPALGQPDPAAEVSLDAKGNPEPDPSLRDTENVPLGEPVEEYFAREVLPHVPDLPATPPTSGEFCVYVLKCSDGSFYKGQTDDFPKRFREHQAAQVSWTAKHLPVTPIH